MPSAWCSLTFSLPAWSIKPTSPSHVFTGIQDKSISAVSGTWPVEVGVVKDFPVPVLIGRDWPGFDRLLAMTTQPASPRRDRQRRKPRKGPRQRPVLLASDSGRDGESPSQNPNLFYDVFQQVMGGGSFGKEQREDDRLKHCWTQVRIIEGKEAQPGPHPLPHFVVQNGLLYCVAQRRGEEKLLLVVPRTKTETVLELAHSHPLAGHLGATNTSNGFRFRRCSVQSTIRMAPLNLCFYILFYVFLLSLFTRITSALFIYDKRTLLDIGHRCTNLLQDTLSTDPAWPLEILRNTEVNKGRLNNRRR